MSLLLLNQHLFCFYYAVTFGNEVTLPDTTCHHYQISLVIVGVVLMTIMLQIIHILNIIAMNRQRFIQHLRAHL